MPEWGDMNCIADSRVLKDKILSEIMVRDFANSHRLWVNIWQNMIRKGLEARTQEHMVGYKLNQPTIPCRNMAGWSICYGCQFFKSCKGSCPQWHSLIFSNDFLVFVLGFQVLKFYGVFGHRKHTLSHFIEILLHLVPNIWAEWLWSSVQDLYLKTFLEASLLQKWKGAWGCGG